MRIGEAKGILGLNGDIDLETGKRAYREACRKYHPDVNPAGTELIKLINNAWETIEKALSEGWNLGASPISDIPEFMENIVNEIKKYKGLRAEIIGSWIWVTGNTYIYKDVLNGLGLKYAKNKKAWYWHAGGYKKRSKKEYGLNEIRNTFGAYTVKEEEEGAEAIK